MTAEPWEEVWEEVRALVEAGHVKGAVRHAELALARCPCPRLKALIGATFSNDPSDIAREIGRFVGACEKRFPVQAVYLEMTGFHMPDWGFDCFGYRKYIEDPADLDWLCAWDSDDWPEIRYWPEIKLTGLEEVVEDDFAWYGDPIAKPYMNEEAKETADLAYLLMMCKFCALIEDAVKTGLIGKRIPVLATVHDFEFVARFEPWARAPRKA